MSELPAAAGEAYELTWRPESPRQAREAIRRATYETGWRGDTEAAVLATSELATNALRHGGGIGTMRVAIDSDRLRVEATDDSSALPVAGTVGEGASSGRGLFIVGTLATAWGVRPAEVGKTVWFEMGCRG